VAEEAVLAGSVAAASAAAEQAEAGNPQQFTTQFY
jgi:hypothetical protein